MDGMFRRRILVALFVLVVVLSGFYFFNKVDESPEQNPGVENVLDRVGSDSENESLIKASSTEGVSGKVDLGGETEILITASGFFPDKITIREGDRVTFKNTDTEGHWPASDAHPSHTIFPEFDPKTSIQPGKSWSFIFNKVGAWRFHDHESPLFRGMVTVTSKGKILSAGTSSAPADSTDCLKTSTDFSCFEDYYDNLVAKKGVAEGFIDLKKRFPESAYIRAQCHPLTHVIGRGAVELYPSVSGHIHTEIVFVGLATTME